MRLLRFLLPFVVLWSGVAAEPHVTTSDQTLALGQRLRSPDPVFPTCGPQRAATAPRAPLPRVVTGRVSFYAALYGVDGVPVGPAVALGPTNAVMPLASLYKTLVVWAALREVDAGRLRLASRFATTPANRSIEEYSRGENTVLALARAALTRSENTASDILHRVVGPQRLARLVRDLSGCTEVLLPTKTFWAAQAGLLPELLPASNRDVLRGAARSYQALAFEEKLVAAARLVEASRRVDADVLLRELDVYFKGPTYDAAIDTALQNTSTASAFTDLLARVVPRGGLSTSSGQILRGLLEQSCCRPTTPPRFSRTFWAAKAGSGWRLLTLSGVVGLPNGRVIAYTYLNHESDTLDSLDMERQIRPVVTWIEGELGALAR